MGRELRWRLDIAESRCQGVLILALAGRIGQAAVHLLSHRLETALARGEHTVVDFAAVDYVSGAAVDLLCAAARRSADSGTAFAICGLAPPVRVTLEMAGATDLLPIEPAREAAIRRVSARS